MYFDSLAVAAMPFIALAAPTIEARRHYAKETVNYCSAPNVCATTTITNTDCHTLDGDFTSMIFPADRKCTAVQRIGYEAKLFGHQGWVSSLRGNFDAKTNTDAIKYGVGNVGSFICG